MKNVALFVLAFSLSSLNLALASEQNDKPLVPAHSLEEMMNAGVDENSNDSVADFDDHHHHPHGKLAICKARNGRGERFEARGFSPKEAQEEAMKKCYRESHYCFELGCYFD